MKIPPGLCYVVSDTAQVYPLWALYRLTYCSEGLGRYVFCRSLTCPILRLPCGLRVNANISG